MTTARAPTARAPRGAVFFDRDGVLNVDTGFLYEIGSFAWMPGAREAIRLVNDLGLYAFVVTNQSGVARGYYREDDVRALHAHMVRELAQIGAHIDDFRYCPHHPQAEIAAYRRDCACRKPAPGMILDLMRDWPVDARASVMLGDKPSDIEAAQAAGVRGVRFDAREPLDAVLREALARPL